MTIDENDVAVATRGGIEAVVRAMGAHTSSAIVQEHGCGAVCNLSLNNENRVAVATKRGIEAVVSAMGDHRSCESVQAQGCLALKNIASSISRRHSQVRSAGAVPLLVEAVSAFPDQELLQKWGKLFLEELGS